MGKCKLCGLNKRHGTSALCKSCIALRLEEELLRIRADIEALRFTNPEVYDQILAIRRMGK